MAISVLMDGIRIDVNEPRVAMMIEKLVTKETRIADVQQGHVEMHFAAPTQALRFKLTEAERG